MNVKYGPDIAHVSDEAIQRIILKAKPTKAPPEYFAEQVERYARKDSGQFTAVISITVWMETNGFDS